VLALRLDALLRRAGSAPLGDPCEGWAEPALHAPSRPGGRCGSTAPGVAVRVPRLIAGGDDRDPAAREVMHFERNVRMSESASEPSQGKEDLR
jgi:hypothetical protein